MVFCSSLALSLLLFRLHVSNIRTPHRVLYYVDFGTAFLIRFEVPLRSILRQNVLQKVRLLYDLLRINILFAVVVIEYCF